jgi:hypothetical protein
MLEQWVIDKLDPVKGEKLIILADPQRMIRAGAQAANFCRPHQVTLPIPFRLCF